MRLICDGVFARQLVDTGRIYDILRVLFNSERLTWGQLIQLSLHLSVNVFRLLRLSVNFMMARGRLASGLSRSLGKIDLQAFFVDELLLRILPVRRFLSSLPLFLKDLLNLSESGLSLLIDWIMAQRLLQQLAGLHKPFLLLVTGRQIQ